MKKRLILIPILLAGMIFLVGWIPVDTDTERYYPPIIEEPVYRVLAPVEESIVVDEPADPIDEPATETIIDTSTEESDLVHLVNNTPFPTYDDNNPPTASTLVFDDITGDIMYFYVVPEGYTAEQYEADLANGNDFIDAEANSAATAAGVELAGVIFGGAWLIASE